jgi:predicted DNA-binding transcriptional regulator AlpA
MKDQLTPAYARPAEAARYFSVNKSTLWRWSKREDFPKPSRIGRKITLFEIAAVERWLKAHGEAAQ